MKLIPNSICTSHYMKFKELLFQDLWRLFLIMGHMAIWLTSTVLYKNPSLLVYSHNPGSYLKRMRVFSPSCLANFSKSSFEMLYYIWQSSYYWQITLLPSLLHCTALHWLPVKSRADFKVLLLLLTYNGFQTKAFFSLSELLYYYEPIQALCSSEARYLMVSRIKKTRSAVVRSFFHRISTLWNNLPSRIRHSEKVFFSNVGSPAFTFFFCTFLPAAVCVCHYRQ